MNKKILYNCKFCGIRNKNQTINNNRTRLSSDSWISKIQIRLIIDDEILDELSVCPQCRKKHTIDELYMRKIDR